MMQKTITQTKSPGELFGTLKNKRASARARIQAMRELAYMNYRRAIPTLIDIVQYHTNSNMRYNAVLALEYLRADTAAEVLEKAAVADEEPLVMRRAFWALQSLGN